MIVKYEALFLTLELLPVLAQLDYCIPPHFALILVALIALFCSGMDSLQKIGGLRWNIAVSKMGFGVISSLLAYSGWTLKYESSLFVIIVCGCIGLLGREFIIKTITKLLPNERTN